MVVTSKLSFGLKLCQFFAISKSPGPLSVKHHACTLRDREKARTWLSNGNGACEGDKYGCFFPSPRFSEFSAGQNKEDPNSFGNACYAGQVSCHLLQIATKSFIGGKLLCPQHLFLRHMHPMPFIFINIFVFVLFSFSYSPIMIFLSGNLRNLRGKNAKL